VRTDAATEDLLRELAPQVLGVLARRYGQFEECEDAVQEAVLAAARGWPGDGVPTNPRGWLITAAARRMIDQMRSDQARRAREVKAAAQEPGLEADLDDARPDTDDTLILLYLCCHPVLTPSSQIALTLRAVGGLTTAEIAHAFMVPEGTMAARISRAKQNIKAAGGHFSLPAPEEQEERLRVVLQVLYLIFNEGYTASSGDNLYRADLATEAIRLARMVRRQLPEDGEVAGLLALMLFTDSRSSARTGPRGELIPLGEQDRTRWDTGLIAEGTALITDAMAHSPLGPYQLQAAIAAMHADADDTESTDWRQVNALYKILERIAPNPMVTLNRAVVLAEIEGPQAGIELLSVVEDDARMAGHHRLHAVRAHLQERAGDLPAALENYELAARLTASLTERRYLQTRASRLVASGRHEAHAPER
jgi:RNA polymerase sigma factor (sigma-70 family)